MTYYRYRFSFGYGLTPIIKNLMQQALAALRARELERGRAPGPVVLDPVAASAMSSVKIMPPR